MKSLSKVNIFVFVFAICAALFSVSALSNGVPYDCPPVFGGYDLPVIECEDVGAKCNGTKGNDVLIGDVDEPQELNGGDGDDCLIGGNEGDVLNGGWGDDYLNGGAGNDTLNGGWGEDELFGGPGDDILLGGNDSDDLDGAGDTNGDECYGGNGIEWPDGIENCEECSYGREGGGKPPSDCP